VPIVPYDTALTDNSGANSYVSAAEVRAYGKLRGFALPADDDKLTVCIMKAMDYLESYEDEFKGDVTDFVQPLQWPRTGVYFNNAFLLSDMYDDTKIPQRLKDVQSLLACVNANGVDFYPISIGSIVKRKKVDVIEKEFFAPGALGGGNSDGTPMLPGIDALIKPLIESGSGFGLQVVRA
jgi:hypothetical protein